MKVSLFVSCLVDQLFPVVGDSTVKVLKKLGVEVEFDRRQTCCGQPAFNSGYVQEARQVASGLLEIFENAGTRLFDTSNDPNQLKPISDSDIKQQLIQGLIEILESHECPIEIYSRFNLTKNKN